MAVAGWLLLPGAAFACGGEWDVADIMRDAQIAIIVYFLVSACVIAFVGLPVWGVKYLWKLVSGHAPQIGAFSVPSCIAALLLGAVGVIVVPAYKQLFDSFGADLPMQTQILVNYSYLLPAAVIPFAFLLYALKHEPRRERDFAAFLAGECGLFALVGWALYSPIFRMC